MQNAHLFRTITVFLAIVMLAACSANSENRIATEVALGISQTQQISQLETAAAGAGAEPAASSDPAENNTATIEPSDTPTASSSPTITLSPTQEIPLINVSQDTNCRNGPATGYVYLTTVSPDQEYEVVGLWTGGNEYVIIDAGSYECWLWTRFADRKDFSDFNLPVLLSPATPTPTYAWNGSWQSWLDGFNFPSVSFVQNGQALSFSITAFGVTVPYSGGLSDTYQIATGTWDNGFGTTGTFQISIKAGNTNQFIGSSTVDGGATNEFCGARNGASKPSPCQWP